MAASAQPPAGIGGASAQQAERSLLRLLASYAPPQYIRRLAERPTPSEAGLDAPRFGVPLRRGAVLLADISGFTALTEQLCREGPAGAELLAAALNAYFSQIIDAISQAGGEVVQFAGDGLIAL